MAAFCLLMGAGAAAQTADSLDRVRVGQTVYLTTTDGLETEGRVVSKAAASAVELLVGRQPRTFRADEIRRIETRDGLRNGAITGGVIGATAMAAFVAWAIEITDEGQGVSGDDIFAAVRLTALAAGAGALVGAGIDRAIDGRQTIYEAPRVSGTVTVRPLWSPTRAGAIVTVVWP
jgi:hypothetical protein